MQPANTKHNRVPMIPVSPEEPGLNAGSLPMGTADNQVAIWKGGAWTVVAAPTVTNTYISFDGTVVKWDYMRANNGAP
jgi:hypothetical protein